jgi:hypothetical protein
MDNIAWYMWVSWYMIIGVINAIIIDMITIRIVHLKNEGEGFTNWQRLFLITLWPIYSFLFWYTFWKTWFASKK